MESDGIGYNEANGEKWRRLKEVVECALDSK